jgi:hypothetical protein
MSGPGTALQGAFTSGELAPSLSARVDLDKYVKGCRTLKNFLVQAHGGAVKRQGFELLDALPGEAALVPFVFNQDQAYCLVFGQRWMRVAMHDGFVLSAGGAPYQIESPYTLAQAKEFSSVQSADVLFIACRDIAPHKLQRYGHTDWRFKAMSFTAPIEPPGWDADGTFESTLAFALAHEANTVYYRSGSGLSSSYKLVDVPLYRKIDPDWAAHNHVPYDKDVFIREENPGDGPEYIYTQDERTLYVKTHTSTSAVFVNGAKMSDGSKSPAQLTTPYTYYVTAVDAQSRESELSVGSSITGPASNNWQGGDYISLLWDTVPGAVEYRVYKSSFGGRPGFVAIVGGQTYNDYNASSALSEGAPKYEDPFPNGDYPGTVSLFEQRLVFASSRNRPQTIWMSKTGDYDNFAKYDPTGADSPLELTIASREVSGIEWIVPLRSLILGTADMEWEISARGEEAFSGKSAQVTPQSYWGSSLRNVITIGNVILHVSSSGRQVRNLQYDFTSDSYGGADLSILAAHLLEEYRITSWTYQKSPDSIVWAVREDGALLGLTFQNEHQVAAWHRHETQGAFRTVCSVPHGYEHSLFAVVERGGTIFFERMAERFRPADPNRAVFLDCATTYEGNAKQEITGLGHLEGKEVGIYADGAVHPPRIVQEGAVRLASPASLVTVGLRYSADLETMPVEVVGRDGTSVALKKTINVVDLLFRDSLGVKAGLSFKPGALQEIRWRTTEAYGKPPALYSGMKSVTVPGLAENVATVCLRSDTPTPVTVLAIVSRIKVQG